MKAWAPNRSGFTIVELLIVIVVIAILAAITIVAYNGIQSRSKNSALASQLASVARKVELSKVENGDAYPMSLSGLSLPTDAGSTYTYFTSVAGDAYCLALKKGNDIVSISNSTPASIAGGCASIFPGALGWWPLNGDGSEVSGNARTLEMLAGMSTGVGQSGGAGGSVSFTGSAQPTIPSISLTNTSFTVAGWINVATFNNNGSYTQAPMLGARSTAGGSLTAMHFGLRAANSTSNPRVYMDYYAAGQAATTTTATNTWYHIAYSFDSTNNQRRFYLNGVLDATYSVGGLYRGVMDTIGYSCCMTSGLNGRLDDVRVFGRTLSDAEIATIYGQGGL